MQKAHLHTGLLSLVLGMVDVLHVNHGRLCLLVEAVLHTLSRCLKMYQTSRLYVSTLPAYYTVQLIDGESNGLTVVNNEIGQL